MHYWSGGVLETEIPCSPKVLQQFNTPILHGSLTPFAFHLSLSSCQL